MGKLACADMRTSDGRIAQKTIAGVPKVRSNRLSCAADAESGGCADRVLARRATQTFGRKGMENENGTGKKGRTLSDFRDGKAGGSGKSCASLLGGRAEASDPAK